MRVTAGTLRGRKITVPDLPGLRPTPAKVRQALFNMLADVSGLHMLDLFAGSGMMALEALSRGAASVHSIEQQRRATQAMLALRDAWKPGDWHIISADVERALTTLSGEHFDLIFADPPYQQGFTTRIPELLDKHQIGCSQLIIEESRRVQPEWPDGWICSQSRQYGDTCLHFLNRQPT